MRKLRATIVIEFDDDSTNTVAEACSTERGSIEDAPSEWVSDALDYSGGQMTVTVEPVQSA